MPKSELETAEEFALGIIDRCSLAENVAGTDKNFRVTPAAIAKVEADRAAVRLALLDEVSAIDDLGPNPKTGTDYDMADVPSLREAIAALRAKHAEPAGRKEAQRKLRVAVEDCEYAINGREGLKAELRKRDAVIEAARKADSAFMAGRILSKVSGDDAPMSHLHFALSALDQAASEPEATERAIVVGSTWRNKKSSQLRKVVHYKPGEFVTWVDGEGYSHTWDSVLFWVNHTWVSDPEAAESVPSGVATLKA